MRDHADITVDESGMTVITSNTGDITITTGSDMSDGIIDISGLTVDTIDIDSITLTDHIWDGNITINEPVEFEDNMPSVAKIEDMCNDYPGLRKAYENFKAVYKMVHQDWQGRQDAEDQFPF